MVEIPLTKGYVALIDDSDLRIVSLFKHWQVTHNKRGGTLYAKRGGIKMHRLIMGLDWDGKTDLGIVDYKAFGGSMSVAEAYPLYWPEGWKRSKYREHSRFKTGFGAARNLLFAELERMGARKIILSTCVPLRNDGLPRANVRPDGGDSGVAVYFQRNGKDMVFACDKYRETCDNIYAIAKTIDAMRGIERWGASDMMERAFAGFKALAAQNERRWWDVLEVRPDATTDVIEANFRRLLRDRHPDAGGSHEAMTELNVARQQALNERKAA